MTCDGICRTINRNTSNVQWLFLLPGGEGQVEGGKYQNSGSSHRLDTTSAQLGVSAVNPEATHSTFNIQHRMQKWLKTALAPALSPRRGRIVLRPI
jgi:hypothetical protein